MRRVLIATAAAALVGALAVVQSAPSATPADSSALRAAVTAPGILAHEQALQAIASANGGTRASGTPGFDASLAYVKGKLDAAMVRWRQAVALKKTYVDAWLDLAECARSSSREPPLHRIGSADTTVFA